MSTGSILRQIASLSAEQLSEVEEAAKYLAALIDRFGISNRKISRQEAQHFAAKEPNRIFSQGGDHVGRWRLSAGFTDGFDFYYVSRVPFEELPSS
jgi:precorrin-6B methylase 2